MQTIQLNYFNCIVCIEGTIDIISIEGITTS